MVWKSNFDCAEFSDGVRLQHKTASSSQTPTATSTTHFPLNSHTSVLRSKVSPNRKEHGTQQDGCFGFCLYSEAEQI